MPAILRTTACRSLAASSTVRFAAATVRYNATAASPPSSTPALFMSGPAAQKVQSESRVVKYAGKKKPITPGIRHTIQIHHPHLHKEGPLRDLTLPLRRSGGRNDTGRVVNRFVGGGHKRRLRIVDFHRKAEGEHDVVRIEYDPGRSAHIALVKARSTTGSKSVREVSALELDVSAWGPQPFAKQPVQAKELEKVCGGYSYILAPDGLRAGDVVRSYRNGIPAELLAGLGSGGYEDAVSADASELDTDPASPQTVLSPSATSSGSASSSRALGMLRTLTLKPGNVLPLDLCPPGTIVHNISLKPEGKMQLCRSAGTFGQIVAHGIGKRSADGQEEEQTQLGAVGAQGWTLVKLQSGEVRKLHPKCVGTIGVVSNKEHQQEQIGKAGRKRWMGIKPRVRGVAMNACDHPHGGGRGKSKGNKHPRSVFGWLTKGKRTRRPRDKDGNKMVVTERPRGRATKN